MNDKSKYKTVEEYVHPSDEDTYLDRIVEILLDGSFIEEGEKYTFENIGGKVHVLWERRQVPYGDENEVPGMTEDQLELHPLFETIEKLVVTGADGDKELELALWEHVSAWSADTLRWKRAG
jgi:hypothetical protein